MKKTNHTDPLKNLFHELPEEQTSELFLPSLMQEVEKMQEKKQRKSFRMSILLPVAGILGVIVLSSLLLYYFDKQFITHVLSFMSELSAVFSSFPSPAEYSSLILYAAAVLLLLMFDTLFRRKLQKHYKR